MPFDRTLFDRLNAGKTGVTAYGEPMAGDPSSLRIAVEGFIETGNATLFQTEMLGVISSCTDVRTIVIDMGKITYLSSMGIGAFTVILAGTKEAGKKLLLCGVPRKIEDLLRQLGFWDMFEKTGLPDGTPFPATVPCPSCRKALHVPRQGVFRCPSCRSSFSVDRDASAT